MSSIGNYIEKDYLNEIKKISEPYLRIKVLVYTLFENRVNKSGERIIEHIIRVSERMKTNEGKIAGLLHEINDYFDIDYDDLKEFGVSNEIIVSLKLIKQNNNIQLDKIIKTKNYIALQLLTEDMLDNNSNEFKSVINDEYNENNVNRENIKKMVYTNRKER